MLNKTESVQYDKDLDRWKFLYFFRIMYVYV